MLEEILRRLFGPQKTDIDMLSEYIDVLNKYGPESVEEEVRYKAIVKECSSLESNLKVAKYMNILYLKGELV